jgi:hypothetical protein
MKSAYSKLKFHFGTGYSTPLPEGWKIRESPEDFAIGIDPNGQEYYLAADAAYPYRVTEQQMGLLKPGDKYVDLENGVVCLANILLKPTK